MLKLLSGVPTGAAGAATFQPLVENRLPKLAPM